MCSKIYKPEWQSLHGQYQATKVQAFLSYGNTLPLYPEYLHKKGQFSSKKITVPKKWGGGTKITHYQHSAVTNNYLRIQTTK